MTKKEKEEKRKSWEKHIREWERSGLTQIEYCRRNNISDKCFYYWKKKFHSENKSVSFVQLPIPESFSELKNLNFNGSINILFSNDIKIELSDNFNPATLKKAVETLRSIT